MWQKVVDALRLLQPEKVGQGGSGAVDRDGSRVPLIQDATLKSDSQVALEQREQGTEPLIRTDGVRQETQSDGTEGQSGFMGKATAKYTKKDLEGDLGGPTEINRDRSKGKLPYAGKAVSSDEGLPQDRREHYGNYGRVKPYPLPFVNLRLQKDIPGFMMDSGKNHVYVGQASGYGPFDNLGPIIKQAGPSFNPTNEPQGELVDSNNPISQVNRVGAGNQIEGVKLGRTEEVHRATQVDLHSGLVQPGLGPENILLLDLEKEDIGVGEPVVLLDCLSPEKEEVRYGGAILSQAEINKCRKASATRSKQKHWPEREIGSLLRHCIKVHNKYKEAYIVEFPEEEDEKMGLEKALLPLEERNLSSALTQSLKLKRSREREVGEMGGCLMLEGRDGCKKLHIEEEGQIGEGSGDKTMLESEDSLAEEAGQAMPPPFQ